MAVEERDAQLAATGKAVTRQGRIIAYPHHWQFPAVTERTAWEAMRGMAEGLGFEYLAFPWATLIDGLRNNAIRTWDLLRALNTIPGAPPEPGLRRASVAQHIHADRHIDIFAACGVTDLFWSHTTLGQSEIAGVRLHPFPLFPAQTPGGADPADSIHRPRRYLANFIGAHNPRIYLSDVRDHIFRDAGTAQDLLIVKREAWHFDRAVYAEQMKQIAPEAAQLALERQHKAEYLRAIRESVFTLCPSGSGPNSIRIGEALALGSIPVILTRDLALPGPRALWEAACLFEEDSAVGYRRALARMRAMPNDERRARQAATQPLFAQVGPQGWGAMIVAAMQADTAA